VPQQLLALGAAAASSEPHPHPLLAPALAGALVPQQLPARAAAAASGVFAGAPPQSQLGSVPVSQPLMIAAAQPTPGVNVIAPEAQLVAQAPHSMQAPRSTIWARLSAIRKTPCGQTIVQAWQPVHFCASSLRVTTSSM
jgi:hypothetical protein